MEFEGKVFSGRGVATSHVQNNVNELKKLTEEELVEGSLNLVLSEPVMFSNDHAKRFDLGHRLLWPALLNGQPVWAYRWQNAPLHVVEILSSVHLRKTLRIGDGDVVRLALRKSDVGRISFIGKMVWNVCWLGRRHWYQTHEKYYFYTRQWCTAFGATQKEKDKMWDAMKSMSKRLIKRIPLLNSLARSIKRRSRIKHGSQGQYIFERLPIDSTSDKETQSLRKVRNILNYTKTSNSSYSAQHHPAGYHTIEIGGQCLQGQRNPAQRIDSVPVDFQGKSVLDIGCNQGGMLFQLDGQLKWGVGLDFDARMVNAANRIKASRHSNDLHFFAFNLENEPLELIEDLLPELRVDVVFLLSVCMWIKNWREVIECAARISDSMLFETNGTDDQQTEQLEHLNKLYHSVAMLNEASEDDAGQKRRKLVYCEKFR